MCAGMVSVSILLSYSAGRAKLESEAALRDQEAPWDRPTDRWRIASESS